MSESSVWLITGCSTGFGRTLARYLLERGRSVAVTARDPEKVRDLSAGFEDRAIVLALDVTDTRQVGDAVARTESAFGRIDVLVNNAGYGYVGAVEESEDRGARAMFEANFWGTSNMTRAVLPGMRKRRSGTIVNLSSIAGLVGFSAVAYYSASKFAVEGFSEGLARELEPFGVRVIVVAPGRFRTNFAGPSIVESPVRIDEYERSVVGVRRKDIAASSGSQEGDPLRAAEAIVAAVESSNPPLHLVLGNAAVDGARAKIEALRREIDAWEATARATDFPKSR